MQYAGGQARRGLYLAISPFSSQDRGLLARRMPTFPLVSPLDTLHRDSMAAAVPHRPGPLRTEGPGQLRPRLVSGEHQHRRS